MEPILYHKFWIATDTRLGSWNVSTEEPTEKERNNAKQVLSYFVTKGWDRRAIYAMLGNMQGESTINPGYIQATRRGLLPNGAETLEDVPNTVMQYFYYGNPEYTPAGTKRAHGIGLTQWDGDTTTYGYRQQKLVGMAMNIGKEWYDPFYQLYRIDYESTHNLQWHTDRYQFDGKHWVWDDFIHPLPKYTTKYLAWVFKAYYENSAGDYKPRQVNAEWWENYLASYTPPPWSELETPIIIILATRHRNKKPLLNKKEVGANVIKF